MIALGGVKSRRMKAIAARKPRSGGVKMRPTVCIERIFWGFCIVASRPSAASMKLPTVQKNVVLAKK